MSLSSSCLIHPPDREKRLIQMLAEDITPTALEVWPFIVTQDHHGHQDFRASPDGQPLGDHRRWSVREPGDLARSR